MVFLRKTLYIVIALMLVLPVSAKKKAQPILVMLTTEQEQQFTYYWYAARQAIEEHRFADAYTLLEFCHALKPNDPQTLAYLGIIYRGIGKEAQATDMFKQAYEADPNNQWQNYLEPLKQRHIDAQEWKKALAVQDEIDQRKGEMDAFSALTRYRIYAMWGKPKKAIHAIDRYLEIEPTDVRFLLFRLDLMERTGAKKKDLFAMYERVLELDPLNTLVLNNYAYYLAINGGDLNKAERMSAITIREEPNNPTCLDTYGWIMHLQGQDELARFYLNKALQNASTDENKNEIIKHLEALRADKSLKR